MRKRSRIMIRAALAILLASCPLAAGEPIGFGAVHQIAVYADGHLEVGYQSWDVGGDRVWPKNGRAGWKAAYSSAAVTNTFHWERGSVIQLSVTETASAWRNELRDLLKALDQRRGTSGVPTFDLGSEIVEVRPPSVFSDIVSYATQLDMDGASTVVMTADDILLSTRLGPEPLFLVNYFVSAALHEEGGRWVGEVRIDEADVYLVSTFFENPASFFERYGALAFRGALGYPLNCWASDSLGVTNMSVADLDLWDDDTPMARLAVERDLFYYAGSLPRTGSFHDEPKLMPPAETALDLAPYDGMPGDLSAYARPVVLLTNLVALDADKPIELKFFRRTEGARPKQRRVVKLKGTLIDRTRTHAQVGEWYPVVFLNEIKLGRERHADKLRNAVRRFGSPAVIDGREWRKALRVKMKLTGWWGEDGPRQGLVRYFYLTDSSQEP